MTKDCNCKYHKIVKDNQRKEIVKDNQRKGRTTTTKELLKLKTFFNKLEKKPIFVCESQIIKRDNKSYKVPKCNHIELDWEDWMTLRKLISVVLK